MKKILILITLFVTVLEIQAQIPPSDFTVNGQTFLVKVIGDIQDPKYHLKVTNSQSPIKSGQVVINGTLNDECYNQLIKNDFYRFDYRKEDFLKFYNILKEVFPSRRALQIGLEEIIIFRFSMSSQGQILDIKYQFKGTLPLTTQEIALLDKRLRESMFFTLKPNNICSSWNVIDYDWWFFLKDLQSPYGNGLGPIWEENDRDLQDLINMGADPRN